MNEQERLEDYLLEHGIRVDEIDLGIEGLEGYTRIDSDGAYIAVKPCLSRFRKTAVIYHEVGHLVKGITGQPRKDERRATQWACDRLITLDRLIDGLKRSPSSVAELAGYMGVDERLLYRYLSLRAAAMEYVEHGDYVISFSPVMLYNWQTGQMWPTSD